MEEVSVRIAKAQAGDKQAREVLIEENLGLVHHIVRRFLGRGYEAEDLFQIGTIGLMKAIDKFDLTYDVKFSTYAVPMISGEIKRFLRDDGMVKVGRSLKENGFKVKAVCEIMAQKLGREPTLQEVARETNLEIEEVVMAMEAGAEVESIYKSVYQADGSEIYLIDKLASEDREKEELLNQMLVNQLLADLGEQERELITMRFFGEKTQMEVAKELGISQVQVSRLEKKILIGMRKKVI